MTIRTFHEQNDKISDLSLQPPEDLRIAALLPCATEIVGILGLAAHLTGVTHECDVCLPPPSLPPSEKQYDEFSYLPSRIQSGHVRVATLSHLDIHATSQSEIDAAVSSSVTSGDGLYKIDNSALVACRPSLVLSQDLCAVCCPTPEDVRNALVRGGHGANSTTSTIAVVSLNPHTLEEVSETFVTVAEACGVRDRGKTAAASFIKNIERVSVTTQNLLEDYMIDVPKMLLLEWIDPPFDGGHWIPRMISLAGCVSPVTSAGTKSHRITWEDVYKADPDVVLVACCGFDLARNLEDARRCVPKLKLLRAYRQNKIYAADGNRYFARPGPSLVGGVGIIARIALDDQSEAVTRLEEICGDLIPKQKKGWDRVDFSEEVVDVEDCVKDFTAAHNAACKDEKMTYVDPQTGYQVFTEIAHKKRGKCCGSGCRHCPYNHENVKNKASRIQQPAILYTTSQNISNETLFSSSPVLSPLTKKKKIKILFFSTGKDSFMAIRALCSNFSSSNTPENLELVLLTTFDATSRVIAHQDNHIDVAVRQASHLDLTLVGVPMHRGTSESYISRISRGIEVAAAARHAEVDTLVFGDLHLEHIREWREMELSKLGYVLEYPLWKIPYNVLLSDLEQSGVPCVVSASTVEVVDVGTLFSREWSEKIAINAGIDGFGEKGEFHTVAKVWKVSKERALGLI